MRATRTRTLAVVLAALAAATAPAAAQNGGFGTSVVIGDGEILVSEPANTFRPGVVYVYGRSGGEWRETAQLTAPDAERGDRFGNYVALSGAQLFVSSRDGVHVFGRARDVWQHSALVAPPADVTAAMQFGTSLSADSDWLFVGAPAAASRRPGEPGLPGSVHVYRRALGVWTHAGTLQAPDATAGDLFGATVQTSGGRLLVGAPGVARGVGAVHAFSLNGAQWQHTAALAATDGQAGDAFGSSIVLLDETAAVGAPGSGEAGAVFVFRRRGTEWTQERRFAAENGAPADRFGTSFAVSGSELIVGAPRGGRGLDGGFAQVFRGAAPLQRITPVAADPRDAFGRSIALRGDVAAIGATGVDLGAGGVYVFERGANGVWAQTASLISEPDVLESVRGEQVRCGEDGTASVFECSDVELQSFISPADLSIDGRGTRLNDVWGWTDPTTQREYALVGRVDGTSFVDITDPHNPIFIGELPTTPGGPPASTWRDIKVYRDHAFIVADAAGEHGMQVFDLTQLRDVRNAPRRFEPTAHYTRINSAHNIVINEETGFAYSVGSSGGGETCGGGLHMIDVRDPRNPVFAGCFADGQTGRASTGYSHDAQCVVYRGPDERYTDREICLGSNENSLSIADVTDKANPVALSRAAYPTPGYTHQGWFDEEQRYFYMNDELDEIAGTASEGTRTIIWDLERLDDPQLHREFIGTTRASDHNLYVRGNLMYQSNYRAGLRIIDITDPANPVEVGYFDTAPYLPNEPGFSGTWSNYPYFPSGNVIVTSVQEGLFVLKKRSPNVVF